MAVEGLDPAGPAEVVGEAVIAVVRRHHPPLCETPEGMVSLPGPGLLLAARYQSSATGAFNELTVFEPAREGIAIGLAATLTIVSDARAAQAGPLWWGVSRRQGSIGWTREGDTVRVTWVEGALELRAVPGRATLPFLLPIRTVQRRRGREVAAALHLRGLGHLAHVECTVAAGDGLAPLSTVRRGLVVSAQQLRWSAATDAILRTLGRAVPAPTASAG